MWKSLDCDVVCMILVVFCCFTISCHRYLSSDSVFKPDTNCEQAEPFSSCFLCFNHLFYYLFMKKVEQQNNGKIMTYCHLIVHAFLLKADWLQLEWERGYLPIVAHAWHSLVPLSHDIPCVIYKGPFGMKIISPELKAFFLFGMKILLIISFFLEWNEVDNCGICKQVIMINFTAAFLRVNCPTIG